MTNDSVVGQRANFGVGASLEGESGGHKRGSHDPARRDGNASDDAADGGETPPDQAQEDESAGRPK